MKKSIPLHPRTNKQLELSAHASVVILANDQQTANVISLQYAAHDSNVQPLNEAGDTITIDTIRRLKSSASLKSQQTNTFLLLSADNFTTEAQNAFLKILEEPDTSSRFVLAASTNNRLLSTIRSRCQTVEVFEPEQVTIKQYLSNRAQETDIEINILEKIYKASRNSLGVVFTASQASESVESEISRIDAAKSFIQNSAYERIALLNGNISSREDAQSFLDMLLAIFGTLTEAAEQQKAIDRYTEAIRTIEKTKRAIARNVNYKASLHALALKI